jgi:hypothetical protein
MFFAKVIAQPFAPTSTGDCGLALLEPAWVDAQDDEGSRLFNVFMTAMDSTLLDYIGDYIRVPLRRTTIDWSLLPETVRSI